MKPSFKEMSLVMKKTKHDYAIDPALMYLVNKCFENGTFSKHSKETVIISIHKCGNVYEADNYKPSDLLFAIENVLQKIFSDRITTFLEKILI